MTTKRGASSGDATALELGIDRGTYYRLERGDHQPSYATARALAAWLGWTTDQVMEAAEKTAPSPETTEEP